MDAPEELLSTTQVAAHLAVHRITVIRWIEAGRIPALRTPTGHYRIRRVDLEPFLTTAA